MSAKYLKTTNRWAVNDVVRVDVQKLKEKEAEEIEKLIKDIQRRKKVGADLRELKGQHHEIRKQGTAKKVEIRNVHGIKGVLLTSDHPWHVVEWRSLNKPSEPSEFRKER